MCKKTKKELQDEYTKLSWDYEFSRPFELALEELYVQHSSRFTGNIFKEIQLLHIVFPTETPQDLTDFIDSVRTRIGLKPLTFEENNL